MILAVDGVTVRFGGITALSEVDVALEEGGCLGIIGPNGAGKSTLLNAISGLVPTQAGSAWFNNRTVDLFTLEPWNRARLGVARTFQHSRLFAGLTVTDQLLCGGYSGQQYGLFAAICRLPATLSRERHLHERARQILGELGLSSLEHAPLNELPGPHRRLVDLGRAMMSSPRVLLLDEIGAGLAADEKSQLVRTLRRHRRAEGCAMVVIEHDLEFVRALAESVVVLTEGRTLAAGPTAQVLQRPDVLAAYVGAVPAVAS